MATRIITHTMELNDCRECPNHMDHETKDSCRCTALGLRKISIAVDNGAQLFPTWCPLPRGDGKEIQKEATDEQNG